MRIGIFGGGTIGTHIITEAKQLPRYDIKVYDPAYLASFSTEEPNGRTYYSKQAGASSDFDVIFIAVPTDTCEDGSCDVTKIYDVLGTIHDLQIKTKCIAIRSTLPPSKLHEIVGHHPNVFFLPEFWGNTPNSRIDPDFVIVAGPKHLSSPITDYFYSAKNSSTFRVILTEDYKAASLAKYAENAFLAMKVAFFAEFKLLCDQMGVAYPEFRDLVTNDPRIGRSHTFIKSGQPYWDSHCLNKDVPAIIAEARTVGMDMQLIDQMQRINASRKF